MDGDTLTTGALLRDTAQLCQQLGLSYDCLGDGTIQSEVAIVAEAPGERETILKAPLIGGSGQFLWNVLRKYDLNRRNTYVTNVVKRQLLLRVGEDEFEKSDISKGELDMWQTVLRWELCKLPNLKYVIALGKYALQALTGNRKITDYRGSVLPATLRDITSSTEKQVHVLCTFNPAHIQKEPRWEVMFRFDLDKIRRLLNGTFKPHVIEPHINPTYEQATDWLRYIHDRGIRGDPVSYDIETPKRHFACLGLSIDPHEGFCINLRRPEGAIFTLDQEVNLRMAMQSLLFDSRVKLVAQNANFDMSWLWFRDRIRTRRTWFDTMLAHHTLYPTLPHSLGFLVSQYTDHPFYKDERESWREGRIDEYFIYNVKDACLTLGCQRALLAELIEQKLDKFYFEHVMRLQPHLVRSTVVGVKADVERKKKLAEDLGTEVAQLRQEFYEKARSLSGDNTFGANEGVKSLAANTPAKISDLFFNRLGLVGRGTSTDKVNRDRIRGNPRTSKAAIDLIDTYERYKKEQKFLSTYAETDLDADGRWRCEWRQTGVAEAPGRLSSRATLWGAGSNLQNQPNRAKEMFIADEGFEFTYFDMSQIEARIVGWLAPIPKWIDQFERARLTGGYDAHRALAAEMYNIPYEQVPKEDWNADGTPTIRYIAKRCRHGLNYRMMIDRLATVLNMPYADAERIWWRYHKTNPEVQEWWTKTIHEAKTRHELFTPLGRRLRIMEKITDEALESIIAFVPQSTNGDHTASVWYKSESDEAWPREARFVINTHDGSLILNRPRDRRVVLKTIKKYAEAPIIINGMPMICPAEFGVSQPDEHGVHRWSTIKKVKINADGEQL